jgi:peptide-methionine (S)-S-oxide reductase
MTLPKVLLLGTALWTGLALAAQDANPFPEPALDAPRAVSKSRETAVLLGGCFWSVEAVFEELAGVTRVVAGLSGGTRETASYEIVSMGRTDHGEAVQIAYDPAKITYGQLLKVFFSVAHDPTQRNRQGPDIGRQYRSAVFYKNEEQKRIAEAYIRQLQETQIFPSPIVTEVSPLTGFYAAESYHQDFVQRNRRNPYVVAYALPKLQKLKEAYPELVRK